MNEAQKIPDPLKRVAEAALCAACVALATWGVDELKAAVKERREAKKRKEQEQQDQGGAEGQGK